MDLQWGQNFSEVPGGSGLLSTITCKISTLFFFFAEHHILSSSLQAEAQEPFIVFFFYIQSSKGFQHEEKEFT